MAKRCMSPSCYAVAVDGESRCEKHLVKRKKEVTEHKNKNRRNAHIYDSRRWRVLSKKAKIMAGGLCEICMKEGVESYGDIADHIIELEDGGDPFSLLNIQIMCHTCHNRKSAKEKRKRNQDNKETKSSDGLVFV